MPFIRNSYPRTFYVLYSPSRKQYVNEDGDFGAFVGAELFNTPYFTPDLDDVRWVGPCEKGSEPR